MELKIEKENLNMCREVIKLIDVFEVNGLILKLNKPFYILHGGINESNIDPRNNFN